MHTQATKGIRRILGRILAGTLSAAVAMDACAERLAPEKLIISDAQSGKRVSEATDNDLATGWADGGKGLLVDLGRATMMHRIYIHPGEDVSAYMQKVRVIFLENPDDADAVSLEFVRPQTDWHKVRGMRQAVLKAGGGDILPAVVTHHKGEPRKDVDVKFNPVRARYLRIEGPARIAALEVYGSADPAAFAKGDAVVVPPDAPDLLRLAAEELRYYIGELTGRPLPIIRPEQESEYPGTLYVIEDLRPLAGTYEEMLTNLKSGKLPTGGPLPESIVSSHTLRLPDGVNVARDGKRVVFRAWPYRNTLHSVWAFLQRQGVVWAYPGPHGDFVPAGKGVDLGILPLTFRPSAQLRYANFSIPEGALYPYTDAFLFFARNGYNASWSELQQFFNQHNEVPPIPMTLTRKSDEVRPEHREGFSGYPHNFEAVIPHRLLEEHPDWCGMTADGKRLPPHKGGPSTFCMTSEGAIRFVADKMLDWIGPHQAYSLVKFDLLPMDSARYCLCESCQQMYKPYQPPDIPYVPGMPYIVSDAYYHFVAEVARRVGVQAPHVRIRALAYADAHAPPRRIDRMPDNVIVELVQYGSRNLPFSSPANEAMRACTEQWAGKAAHLETYEYALIEGEWWRETVGMPIPAVTAIAGRSKFLHRSGVWNGGTQGWIHSLPTSPWNWFAYPQMLWDVTRTPDRLLGDFFNAYYREAAGPMLDYYRTYEAHLIVNDVDLQNFGYDQGPNPDAFPPEIVTALRGHLDRAAAAATTWFVKPRVAQARRDLEWAIPASLRRSIDVKTARQYGKKLCRAGRLGGAIALDGSLDDDAWQAVTVSDGFILPTTHEPVAADRQSAFRLLWDDEHLYVAIRCAHPEIASYEVTDAIWGARTDAIELFLVPDQAYTAAYYQMAVSAFGRTLEPKRYFHDQWHRDTEWTGGPIKAAARVAEGYWTAEIAIPFALLKERAPKAGDVWRLNIARSGAGTWSPLQFGAHHLYRDFNFITFTE